MTLLMRSGLCFTQLLSCIHAPCPSVSDSPLCVLSGMLWAGHVINRSTVQSRQWCRWVSAAITAGLETYAFIRLSHISGGGHCVIPETCGSGGLDTLMDYSG